MPKVFISGATGYLGRPLTEALTAAGCDVHALTRPQSIRKLPVGCTPVPGNALDAGTFLAAVPNRATYIHLTGVSHPSPAKAREFRDIDQVSFEASLAAAKAAQATHFIYVSVAHPAPVMHAYIAVRQTCEARLTDSGLNATILRPWYILGPGHRWPYALLPFYKLAERVPAWRESARRLALVTRRQMLDALTEATSNPPCGIRIVEASAIRNSSLGAVSASPSFLSSTTRRPSAPSA